MGMIADECPRCKRVTRCMVIETGGMISGMILGIPIILPLSYVRCVCGECGHEFKSRQAAEHRAVPFDVAAGLDTESLLDVTNPELHKVRALSRLRAEPQLQNAVSLLDRLSPGPLRFGLHAELAEWPRFDEAQRADLLGRVESCSRAMDFAREMAKRYSFGGIGCLIVLVVATGVWVTAGLTFSRLGAFGWAAVIASGLMAGGVPAQLLSVVRNRRWVREVLLPEAEHTGVSPEWILAILDGSTAPRGTGDELGSLREVCPALRVEFAAIGRRGKSEITGFAPPPRTQRQPWTSDQAPRAD
jgi:hypothetical protein